MGEAEQGAVARVLRGGALAQGEEVAHFEQELAADLAGTRFAVCTSSGTTALELAVLALGIGPGDEVITTAFTFAATVNAVLRSGATVVLCDISGDYTIDPDAVADAVTAATKLVMPVHLYGLPADMARLSMTGVPLLEDACQAHLATCDGSRTGGLGIAGCFSFYATKNMTCGEGGAITTDDAEVAERVRVLRNQGMRGRYEYIEVGTNARMTDIAASIGRVQLGRLPDWTDVRRRNAALLHERLAGIEGVNLPWEPPGRTHVWHQYTVAVADHHDRDALVQGLAARGISAGVYYPRVLVDHDAYAAHPRVRVHGPLDVARAATGRVLSLPVHQGVSERDIVRIGSAIEEVLA